jgi:hypothetical protein
MSYQIAFTGRFGLSSKGSFSLTAGAGGFRGSGIVSSHDGRELTCSITVLR